MLLKSKKVAYLGVLLALNQVFIFLSSIIETNTLLLFMLAALLVGVVIVEFGVKSGILFYIASSILGFFITANQVEIVTYILFFGLYSLVKYIIEKIAFTMKHARIFEIVIKLLFFNIAVISLYLIMKSIITIKISWWLVLVAQIIFIAYDYAFTVFINYYINKLQAKIKR